MPHEVIMPALGMTQDTGLIVSWLKKPGDSVKAGEGLMEIETDKAVMEVEAKADGFLSNVAAEAGEHVPVGNVVAMIVETSEEISASSSPSSAQDISNDATFPPAPTPAPVQQREQKSSETQIELSVHTGDKILASPKLKRLALEQGLDLAHLVKHGIPQPYHVSDLQTLKNLKSTSNVPALSSTEMVSSSAISQHIEARVPTSQCDDFLAWMLNDGNIELEPSQLWPRFATIALRGISDNKQEDIIIETRHLNDTTGLYINADQTPISTPIEADGDDFPDLILRDLTHSAIILSTTTAQVAPILTIGRTREEYVISLDYSDHHFDENTAINFLNGFGQCLDEPLRHIL